MRFFFCIFQDSSYCVDLVIVDNWIAVWEEVNGECWTHNGESVIGGVEGDYFSIEVHLVRKVEAVSYASEEDNLRFINTDGAAI